MGANRPTLFLKLVSLFGMVVLIVLLVGVPILYLISKLFGG